MKRLASLIFLMAALGVTGYSQERYVRPVDEAKLDPTFLAFREKVVSAAERRDAKYILSILDPNVRLSFGGDQGIKDFKRMWKIDSKTSKFWEAFLPVIKNGGSFLREGGKRKNTFFAPYTFQSFPDDLDSFEYSVIFGSDVNLREGPSIDAKVVSRLSYNIVTVDPASYEDGKVPKPEWLKVKTLGGLSGFVKAEFVRSPIDYRAGFEKKGGRWRMVFFVVGD